MYVLVVYSLENWYHDANSGLGKWSGNGNNHWFWPRSCSGEKLGIHPNFDPIRSSGKRKEIVINCDPRCCSGNMPGTNSDPKSCSGIMDDHPFWPWSCSRKTCYHQIVTQEIVRMRLGWCVHVKWIIISLTLGDVWITYSASGQLSEKRNNYKLLCVHFVLVFELLGLCVNYFSSEMLVIITSYIVKPHVMVPRHYPFLLFVTL